MSAAVSEVYTFIKKYPPVTMWPCGHVTLREQIQEIYLGDKRAFPCPLCKGRVTVLESGISMKKIHALIANVLRLHKLSEMAGNSLSRSNPSATLPTNISSHAVEGSYPFLSDEFICEVTKGDDFELGVFSQQQRRVMALFPRNNRSAIKEIDVNSERGIAQSIAIECRDKMSVEALCAYFNKKGVAFLRGKNNQISTVESASIKAVVRSLCAHNAMPNEMRRVR